MLPRNGRTDWPSGVGLLDRLLAAHPENRAERVLWARGLEGRCCVSRTTGARLTSRRGAARAPNMYMRMYEYNHVSVAGKASTPTDSTLWTM